MMKANGQAEVATEAEVPFEVTNMEVWSISESIKRCANTGLSPDAFLKYIELSLHLEELISKRNKALTLLMNSYEIMKPELIDNMLVWPYQKHPKKNEILEKLSAINKQMVKLTPVKFIPKAEFQSITSSYPFTMGEIVSLSKILVKW
jgi:hypothetical protein